MEPAIDRNVMTVTYGPKLSYSLSLSLSLSVCRAHDEQGVPVSRLVKRSEFPVLAPRDRIFVGVLQCRWPRRWEKS